MHSPACYIWRMMEHIFHTNTVGICSCKSLKKNIRARLLLFSRTAASRGKTLFRPAFVCVMDEHETNGTGGSEDKLTQEAAAIYLVGFPVRLRHHTLGRKLPPPPAALADKKQNICRNNRLARNRDAKPNSGCNSLISVCVSSSGGNPQSLVRGAPLLPRGARARALRAPS